MHFRRELDFDDLIETIDQLADEEIDEVVDWQMTQSPAAKKERTSANTPATPALRTTFVSRIAEAAAEAMGEALASTAPAGERGGYTIRQLTEMRNEAWRQGQRDVALGLERMIQDQSRPLQRIELQPRGIINLPASMMSMPVRYRQIEYAVNTRIDPILDQLHVRLWWRVGSDTERQYQQTAVSYEALQSISRPVPIMRASIDEQRSIIVVLDPRRRDNFRVILEAP